MKLDTNAITEKILPVLKFIKRYLVFIFAVVVLGLYIYLVQHIDHLIQDEPSQAAAESKVKPVNRLKIDKDALKTITDLEAQNIEVKTLFEQARQNPFTEN